MRRHFLVQLRLARRLPDEMLKGCVQQATLKFPEQGEVSSL
jgi:hypothetical protein